MEQSAAHAGDIVELTGEDLYKAFGAENMADTQRDDRNGLYIVSDNLNNASYGTLDTGSSYDGGYESQMNNPYVVRGDQGDRRDVAANNAVQPLHVRTENECINQDF